MNAPDQFRPKRSMHCAMSRNTVFPFEFSASQHDIEVALTGCGRACVTRMAGTVIHYNNLARRKGRPQCIFDFLPNRHLA